MGFLSALVWSPAAGGTEIFDPTRRRSSPGFRCIQRLSALAGRIRAREFEGRVEGFTCRHGRRIPLLLYDPSPLEQPNYHHSQRDDQEDMD